MNSFQEYQDMAAVMSFCNRVSEEHDAVLKRIEEFATAVDTANTLTKEELLKRADDIRAEVVSFAERFTKDASALRGDYSNLRDSLNQHATKRAEFERKAATEVSEPVRKIIKSLFAEMPKPKDGMAGEPGKPGKDASIASRFRGNWNKETVYARDDIFTFRGSSYVVLQDCRGVLPTVEAQKAGNAYYGLLAASGAPGLPGQGSDAGGSGGISWVAAPATAASTGVAGSVAYDSSYFYVCVATNSWTRTPLSDWS